MNSNSSTGKTSRQAIRKTTNKPGEFESRCMCELDYRPPERFSGISFASKSVASIGIRKTMVVVLSVAMLAASAGSVIASPGVIAPTLARLATVSRMPASHPRHGVAGGVNPHKSGGATRRFCMAASAKLPRLLPCLMVSPLRRVKGALRQAAKGRILPLTRLQGLPWPHRSSTFRASETSPPDLRGFWPPSTRTQHRPRPSSPRRCSWAGKTQCGR